MRFVNFPIFVLLSGIVGGIVLSSRWIWSIELLFILLIFSVLLLCVFHFRYRFTRFFRWGFIAIVWATAWILGIWLGRFHDPLSDKNHYVHQLVANTHHSFVVQILDKISENDFGTTYRLQLHTADSLSVKGKMLGFFPKSTFENPVFSRGEIVYLFAYVSPLDSPKNPKQFDYKRYMKRQGVYWRARIYSTEKIGVDNSFSAFYLADSLRKQFSEILSSLPMPEAHSGLLKALLLGMRSELEESVYQDYVDSGAVHILAISGLHVGVITMLLLATLRFVPRHGVWKWIRLLWVVGGLWAFAFVAGLSPSVLRAVTMFTFVGISLAIRRRQGRYDALAMSMLLLLLVRPSLLYEVGFQMSYAAVFSILFFYPKLEILWQPKHRVLRYVNSLFWLGVSAQIGVLPISLYYFHQFPLLFFVSNLLIVPLLLPLLLVGILVLFWGMIATPPSWLVAVLDFLVRWMNGSAGWVSSWETFVIRNIYFDELLLATSILLILTFIHWINQKIYQRTIVLLCSVLIFQSALFYGKFVRERQSNFTVFHQYNNTMIGLLRGNHWEVYTDNPPARLIDNYAKSMGVKTISLEKIPSVIAFDEHIIVTVDSLTVFPQSIEKVDVLLLRQSPKINLERLLSTTSVSLVVADGSNYPSYINNWQSICNKLKVSFHNTNEKGSFQQEDR